MGGCGERCTRAACSVDCTHLAAVLVLLEEIHHDLLHLKRECGNMRCEIWGHVTRPSRSAAPRAASCCPPRSTAAPRTAATAPIQGSVWGVRAVPLPARRTGPSLPQHHTAPQPRVVGARAAAEVDRPLHRLGEPRLLAQPRLCVKEVVRRPWWHWKWHWKWQWWESRAWVSTISSNTLRASASAAAVSSPASSSASSSTSARRYL